MFADELSRRGALRVLWLGLPAVLAACGGRSGPVEYLPLSWDYLPPIRLNAASVDIDDAWKPTPASHDLGQLAPTPPVVALSKMAEDRLVASGNSGKANFVIDSASLVKQGDNYLGRFAVHLDIVSGDGRRHGHAEARVTRSRKIDDDSREGTRTELYDMVKQMMSSMNVELEFQIRRALRDYLETTPTGAPPPSGPVEQQNLPPPTAGGLAAPSTAAPARPAAVPFAVPGPTSLTR
jgi:hypothetical protein